MKVILVDNFDRECIADRLLKDNLTESEAKKIANDYNQSHSTQWDWFAEAVPDDYHLSRGMLDMI